MPCISPTNPNSHVEYLFSAPLCDDSSPIKKIARVAFHIFTLCVPLLCYHGYHALRCAWRLLFPDPTSFAPSAEILPAEVLMTPDPPSGNQNNHENCQQLGAILPETPTQTPQLPQIPIPASTPSPITRLMKPTYSNLEGLFASERRSLSALLNSTPALQPFRFLSNAMLTFLAAEKMHLAIIPEVRRVRDTNGDLIGGYVPPYNCQDDAYHPNKFMPFDVKGFWIPMTAGELFSIPRQSDSSPLLRTNKDGQKEILFLIHPKSETLFAPLMKEYVNTQITISALALSSFRTLLVAIPQKTSRPEYTYTMVKVSLNEVIGNVSRVVSFKECAGSIATTAVIQNKVSSNAIAFMEEDFSFIPDDSLLNLNVTTAKISGAGMIHRPIPACLLNPTTKYVIPFFALFGSKNRPLLDLLIQQNTKTATEFVVDALLTPLAEVFIDLLYFKNISIEAHGQNLLLLLSNIDSRNMKIKLMYRDMGGVNSLLSQEDRDALPERLRNDDYFYCDTHVKDAASVLEVIAFKVMFNLTKQFFKSETYCNTDIGLARWKSLMTENKFAGNWTLPEKDEAMFTAEPGASGGSPTADRKLTEEVNMAKDGSSHEDRHQEDFTQENFYRYGYVEKLFGVSLLKQLQNKGIFTKIATKNPEVSYDYFHCALYGKGAFNKCTNFEWFKELIIQTYPLFIGN